MYSEAKCWSQTFLRFRLVCFTFIWQASCYSCLPWAGWKTTSLWPPFPKVVLVQTGAHGEKDWGGKRWLSFRWNQCGYTWTTDWRQKNQKNRINWSFLRNFLMPLRNLNIYIHLQCLQSTWPFSCASTKAWEPWTSWMRNPLCVFTCIDPSGCDHVKPAS